jgi:hypothetical protein
VLALDDGAIARVLIAATRLARGADRVRLLEEFARRAEQVGKIPHPPRSGLPGAGNSAVERRPRSSDAERMRRYRERLRRGVAYVPLPVTRLIVDYLVRRGLLPRDCEAADRVEIGLAAAAALERAARADR